MGNYRTYSFFSKLGIEDEGYSSLLGEHFRDAISMHMNSRGYEVSATPELQINVSISTDDKIRVNTYQDPYLYGGYYGGFRGPVWGSPMYYGGGSHTTVTQYTEANVYIDFVDARQHKMVWQGVASFTLTEKMQKQVRETIISTVAEVFSNYPVPPNSRTDHSEQCPAAAARRPWCRNPTGAITE
jgi:hypothetical protein